MILKNDDEFLNTINNITCVSDYVAGISYLKQILKKEAEKIPNRTLFFRGVANLSWENIPSIYRNNNELVKNEKNIYHEIISRCPEDFKHCDTTFDHLVMMQHYSIPTRLLDLSTNSLVALYFACNKEFNTDGKVNIFGVQKTNINLYNNHIVSIIANLSKIGNFNLLYSKINQMINLLQDPILDEYYKLIIGGYNLQELPLNYSEYFLKIQKRLPYSNIYIFWNKVKEILLENIKYYQNFIHADIPNSFPEPFKETIKKETQEYRNIVKLCEKNIMAIEELEKNINDISINNEISLESIRAKEKQIIDFITSKDKLFIASSLGIKSSSANLINLVQEEKPHFSIDYVQLQDLESVICVTPKLDNPHIIRQSGAFFLFGLDEDSISKTEVAKIPENFKMKIRDQEIVFIIPQGKKADILEELELFSITEGNLFTDIDRVAEDIKNKYSLFQ